MNRKLLGEQIHGHLQLYKDLGVRYVDCTDMKTHACLRTPHKQSSHARVSEKCPPVDGQAGESACKTDITALAVPESFTIASAETEIASGETLEAILSDMRNCQRCKLWPLRRNLVFGAGNPRSSLMFVGEAPGEDEDEQGLPFVGRAGRLLTLIIESMGLQREDVFICNILKCRPPLNRNPETDEIAACEGFLFRQIAAVRPRVIVALGAFGAQTLLGTTEFIGKLRGRLTDYRGVKLMATYHPAYLLRSPFEKRKVWEDMRIVRDYLRVMPRD